MAQSLRLLGIFQQLEFVDSVSEACPVPRTRTLFLLHIYAEVSSRVKFTQNLPLSFANAGTKVFVDGLVKATDENSTNSVMFAAIRPFESKPGGWIRGYVRRRYLALVSGREKFF